MKKKKKWYIGGVALILGISLIVGVVQHQRSIVNDQYVIVETDDEEVPLTDGIPGVVDLNQKLLERLALVPANVLTSMANNGWVITLTAENLSDRYFRGIYTSVNAVTDSTIKTIWISNTERAITKSAIHEVGHYIDYSNGIINKSEAFKAIYYAEKDNFVIPGGNASYAKSSTQEYFGEAFQECILYPDIMIANCPQTYAFIMACAANL